MNVALLTFDFPPDTGGVQRYLYETARRLARHHNVAVLTPVRAISPDEGLQRIVLPRQRFDRWLLALRALHPHCVIVGHTHPWLLLLAFLVAPRRYLPVAHGNDFLAAQTRWHRSLFNALLRQAPWVITNSEENARRLHALGLSRIKVVYPGTDPRRFTPPSAPVPPPWTLLSVARLVPRKGIDTVIRALPLLLDRFSALRYWIVGDGPERARLTSLVSELQLSPHVTFYGRVADEVLPNLYRAAHVFVLPTRLEEMGESVEGFGIAYLEAAATALPVVASTEGGIASHVRQQSIGLLVPPDDPVALTNVITRLLSQRDLRHRLGQAGRRWVEEEMNWDRTAARIEALLEVCE